MRPKLLLLVCVALASTLFASHGAMAADLDGLINIDDYDPADSKRSESNSKPVDRSDGEGDDEEYSGVQSDESGSGSGDNTTDPSIVDVSVMSPTPEQTSSTTTETSNVITEDTEKPTEDPDNNVGGVDGDETGDGDMLGGGVSAKTGVEDNSSDKSPNAEANIDDEPAEKKVLRVLTTEVIAAVVVGAVCAVILIAFLVYRLRKRDEGSYALSDAGYKDTYKLQGDTGKEAFV